VGLVAARRAVQLLGAPLRPLGDRAAVVLEFSPVANNAAGSAVPWGLSPVLDHLPAGTTVTTFGQPGDATPYAGDPDEPAERPWHDPVEYSVSALTEAVAAAGERPLVLVARDLHRHAWMAEAVELALSARRDAIVVEMGVPYSFLGKFSYENGEPTLIASHGAARVSGIAVAEALTG
jgi:beta-N-acetylhexosaminidase